MKSKFLKGILVLTIVSASLLISSIGANAEWKQDTTGWWYTEDNSYTTGWRLIDGNWYYFYSSGYMASNTIIDGYYLNYKGVWVMNQVSDSNKEKKLFFISRGYEKDNKKYIEGYYNKFVTDLDEARDYEKRIGHNIIFHDETGDYIPDDGFDMPISDTITLEVDDNASINEINFDSQGHIQDVTKDFSSIVIGKYSSRPIFDIIIKDGKVTEMHQEYRP